MLKDKLEKLNNVLEVLNFKDTKAKFMAEVIITIIDRYGYGYDDIITRIGDDEILIYKTNDKGNLDNIIIDEDGDVCYMYIERNGDPKNSNAGNMYEYTNIDLYDLRDLIKCYRESKVYYTLPKIKY